MYPGATNPDRLVFLFHFDLCFNHQPTTPWGVVFYFYDIVGSMVVRNLGLIAVLVLVLALLFSLGRIFSWPGLPADGQPGGVNPSDQSLVLGALTFYYPASQFSLAASGEVVGTLSYLPVCASAFDYCLYYTGGAYEGTNFEAAGIRLRARGDLASERLCLETPPAGYEAGRRPDQVGSTERYSTAVFLVSDAGAGHSASGLLHRFYTRASGECYELETRVAQTQFLNYPAGTIKEFGTTEASGLLNQLEQLVSGADFAG